MFKRIISFTVVFCFFLTTLGPIPKAHADGVLGLPAPGSMVNLSPAYEPALIKGLTVHKDNPFLFDFILDTGHSGLSGDALKKEGDRLVKYFFACLTIPEKNLWVNLSPYEKDRIIPTALGQTALGRDLLAQDYILKQLTASLIYPEKDLGKEFWNRVYAKARQMYGTTEIPVNTFNKVWILADKATVYEHGQTAFVVDGYLKVMLDEDYLALKKNVSVRTSSDAHSIASNIVRQIVLPEIEKEVNTGKNFAMLRQIFYSQILATWYKKNLKQALLNQVYADKSTVKGVNLNDPSIQEKIYQQYLRAYKKGVFNYIKEDTNSGGQVIPRKYFSGGYATRPGMLATTEDPAEFTQAAMKTTELYDLRTVAESSSQSNATAAMRTPDEEQTIIDHFAGQNKKQFSKVAKGKVPEIIEHLRTVAVNGASPLEPYIEDDIIPLLKNQAIEVKEGPDQFFDDLNRLWGIDVQAIHYKGAIIIKAGVLSSDIQAVSRLVIQQTAMILGLSSIAGVFAKIADGGTMDETDKEKMQTELAALLKNRDLFNKSQYFPPAAAAIISVLVIANNSIGEATKYDIATTFHLLTIGVLGWALYKGFKIMNNGRAAIAALDNKESPVSDKKTTIAIAAALVGIAATFYTMHAHPYLSTGGVLGSWAVILWALKKRALKKFLENKNIRLEDVYQKYHELWSISAPVPAPAAIGSLITGMSLNAMQGSHWSWVMASATLFFAVMVFEGIAYYNTKARQLDNESRESFYSGKVGDGLKKAIGKDNFVQFILDMKPGWWIAFAEWMREDAQGPIFLQHLYQPGWGAFAYMLYLPVGGAIAGTAFGIKNYVQWRDRQKRLKELLIENTIPAIETVAVENGQVPTDKTVMTAMEESTDDARRGVITDNIRKALSGKRFNDVAGLKAGDIMGPLSAADLSVETIEEIENQAGLEKSLEKDRSRKASFINGQTGEIFNPDQGDILRGIQEKTKRVFRSQVGLLQETVKEGTIIPESRFLSVDSKASEVLKGLAGKGYLELTPLGDVQIISSVDPKVLWTITKGVNFVQYWALLKGVQGRTKKTQLTGAALVYIVFDAAMGIASVASPSEVNGGIDLTNSNARQTVIKEGNGVEININPAMIAWVKEHGLNNLSPVIFQVTRVPSIWPLVGLKEPEESIQLAKV